MKINVNRIIKGFASFAVIAVVLACSVVVPAFAAYEVLYPKDFVMSVVNEDGVIRTHYAFNVSPVVRYTGSSGSGNTGNGSISFTPSPADTNVVIRYYPLGTIMSGNTYLSGKAIDVSDFKSNSVLSLRSDVTFEIHYATGSVGVPPTSGYSNALAYIYCFDSDGKYIQNISSSAKRFDVTPDSSEGRFWALQTSYDFRLPDNCAYIVPNFNVRFEFPPSPTVISKVQAQNVTFNMLVSKDSVIENSATMQKIEEHLQDISGKLDDANDKLDDTNDKLDDANDKLDDIITGTPEMGEAVEDMEDSVQENKDTFEAVKDLEDGFWKDFEEGTEKIWIEIQNFVEGEGWVQLGQLVSPLMDWEHTYTLMIMVVCFLNLSILLFGR